MTCRPLVLVAALVACGGDDPSTVGSTAAGTGGKAGGQGGIGGESGSGGAGSQAGTAGGAATIGNEDLSECTPDKIESSEEYCSPDYPCFFAGIPCPDGTVCCHRYCTRACFKTKLQDPCNFYKNCVAPKDCAPGGTTFQKPSTCQ